MKRWTMVVVKLITYLLIIVSAFSFLIVYSNSHPPEYPLSRPPSLFGLKFDNVSFETSDGLLLRGWFVPAIKERRVGPAVLICHGLGANKSDFTELAGHLAGAGFHVLLFDFRGHGKSEASRSSFGLLEKEDVRAALEYLLTRNEVDPDRIGVYGFSMGAAAAVFAAAEDLRIGPLVLDSAFTSLRSQGENLLENAYSSFFSPLIYPLMWTYRLYFMIDPANVAPLERIGAIAPRPLLIIGGEEDEQMPSSDAKRLFASAGSPKELWLVPGAVHGGTVYSAGHEYYQRIEAFFSKSLGRD